jgi:hypothetical protein
MSAEACLSRLIPQGVPIRYAEIGVLRATNIVALAEMYELIRITGIDSYEPYVDAAHGYKVGPILSKLNYAIAVDNIRSSANSSRIQLVVEDSTKAAQATADGAYDVVFIDKSLSADGQAKDILDWHSKVTRGGILCGHDAWTACILESVVETLRLLSLPPPQIIDGEVWYTTIPA